MYEPILSLIVVCFAVVLSQLSPGPDVFYVFRTALAQGFRCGVAVAFGINLGVLIQSVLVCTVGAWVIDRGWGSYMLPPAACWLLYLAWKIFPRSWHAESSMADTAPASRESYRSLILGGFFCNILNPKCMLFLLGITGNALRSHAELDWYVPAMVVSLYASSLAGWVLWCALLQWAPLRRQYMRHVQIVDACFALLLAAIAIILLTGL